MADSSDDARSVEERRDSVALLLPQEKRNQQDESTEMTFMGDGVVESVEEHVISVGHAGTWPERARSWLSRLTFYWMGELLVRGAAKALDEEDLWELDEPDSSGALQSEFEKQWRLCSPSLTRTIHHCYGKPFYLAAILKLCYDSLQFVGPMLLGSIIRYLADEDAGWTMGFVYMAVLFLVYSVRLVIIQQYFHVVFRTGMHIRSGLVSAIYRHSLRMSQAEKGKHSTGAIVDLMSNDSQKLMDVCTYLHVLWSGPLQIIVALILLARLIGWATLAGFAVMVILIPVNTTVGRWTTKCRNWMIQHTDERVRWMNELLQAIKGVKLHAYEQRFARKLSEVRSREVHYLYMRVALTAFNQAVAAVAPLTVSVLSLALYSYLGHPMSPEIAFPAIALFALLRFPLQMFPRMVSNLADARSSLKRIQTFLLCDVIDTNLRTPVVSPVTQAGAIVLEDASIAWSSEMEPCLSNVSLDIQPGALRASEHSNRRETVGVIGSVGAGKSCLLHALLGELPPLSGTVSLKGTLAYVPQQAWIMNDTLKNNIVFGHPYDDEWYHRVLQACALLPDLELLPAGDQTEIGERGINLSGGQKQRVSVARAVYSKADIVLLDDPLSALDANVSKHVFHHAIRGLLKNTTVVLVTHYIHLLPDVDAVVVLSEQTVAESGTYTELIEHGGVLCQLVREHSTQDEDVTESAEVEEEEDDVEFSSKKQEANNGRITEQEERDVGAVSLAMYWVYAKAPAAPLMVVIMVLSFCLAQAAKIATDSFIVLWSGDTYEWTNQQYIMVYFGLCLISAVISTFSRVLMAWLGVRAAKRLHTKLLNAVFHAPMSFFESTPTGRILNRFAKDQDSIDSTLPQNMSGFINVIVVCIGTLLMMMTATPLIMTCLIPLAFIYYRVQKYYRCSSRELKRLDSISRSPLFAHFSESLEGLVSIRAYAVAERFSQENLARLDRNQRAYFAMVSANRWLGVRLDSITTCIVTLVCLFTVIERHRIDPGILGLVLGYTVTTVSWFSWLVRSMVDLEQRMNSIERVQSYTNLEHEGTEIDFTEDDGESERMQWPTYGRIKFENAVLSYRPDLLPALDGLSFEILPGEKIGVVGRTGAGKSSLFVALLRLVELRSGAIYVDGVDISTLRLQTLRSRITIIPQDPVLFTGTVRSNLDPFEEYSDEKMWRALEMTQLKPAIESLDGQLDAPVTEVGGGFSAGQKQLLCFARALLKEACILLLDEATASCDVATDASIQTTLRERFAQATVITVAHRLHTIMDSDRVLVMEQGKAVEFDTPHHLLTATPEGVFSSLVAETGEATAKHLRGIAYKASEGSNQ